MICISQWKIYSVNLVIYLEVVIHLKIFLEWVEIRTQRGGYRKAKDLRVSLKLDFTEILNGAEKTIKIKRDENCKTCGGSGAKSGTSPTQCKQCGGSGQVRQVRQSFFGQSVVVSDCPICHGSGEFIENPCESVMGKA